MFPILNTELTIRDTVAWWQWSFCGNYVIISQAWSLEQFSPIIYGPEEWVPCERNHPRNRTFIHAILSISTAGTWQSIALHVNSQVIHA